MVYQNIFEKENGNVGIGIENPPARLSVKEASFEIQGVYASADSDEVTGNGTLFTVQVAVGDQITIGGETRIVTEIWDNTHLKVDSNFTTTTEPPEGMMTVVPDILRVEDSLGKVKLVVSKKGDVGIGIDEPKAKLGVINSLRVSSISNHIQFDKTWGNVPTISVDSTDTAGPDNRAQLRLHGRNPSHTQIGLRMNGPLTVDEGSTTLLTGNVWMATATNDKKVGIATDDPKAKLHIEGTNDASLTGDGLLILGTKAGNNLVMDNNEIMARNAGNIASLNFQADGGDLVVHSLQENYQKFVVKHNGKVGIGTSEPAAKLTVKGEGTCLVDLSVRQGFGTQSKYLFNDYNNPYFCEIAIGDKFRIGGEVYVVDYMLENYLALNYFPTLPSPHGRHYLVKIECIGGKPAPAIFQIEDHTGEAKLIVSGNGNVGIGTTVPGYPLEVSRKDNTRARIAIYSAGDVPNDLFFGSNGQKNRWSISSCESTDGNGYPLTIWRNNGGWSRVMSIDYANGNVGIGTSVLGAKLNVNGNLKLQCGVAINEFSSDGTLSDKSDSAVPTEKAVKSYVDKIQSGRVSIGRTKTFGERKIKRKISYRKFSKSPTVVLGVVGLDVNKRFNTRYKIWVENVTDNGCDVIFRTWSDTDIYLLEAQWIAYGPM